MHDVFISYSSKDKSTADAACHALEQHDVRCWIAPRDETAGVSFARQISDAIRVCSVMVLVFSANANLSKHVIREVGIAFESGTVVIPYRIEPVTPRDDLSYLLHGLHWLDAYPDPDEFAPLVDHVRRNLSTDAEPARPDDPPGERRPAPPVRAQIPVAAPGVAPRASPPVGAEASQGLAPGARLVGQVFSGFSLAGVNAKGSTLSRSVFKKTDLTGSRFDSSVFSGANLEGARLDGAVFRDSRMDMVNLLGASCVETDFDYVRMTRADLRRTNLTRANLHMADATEANFEDAIAVGASFALALLTDADFSSADLTDADFTDAVLDGCRLDGANLTGARGLTDAQLRVAITDRYTILDR
ncbi:MAG TPA: pentapeptide repeat-containing protein [Arachnia sp.]|nr:pentapeptide repeat-containing protein [Arachnia sp.]HMT86304.1 pentapeptide repeat-containing protein [Arachnia sp.]